MNDNLSHNIHGLIARLTNMLGVTAFAMEFCVAFILYNSQDSRSNTNEPNKCIMSSLQT